MCCSTDIPDLEEIFTRGIISSLTGVVLVLWHNYSVMESFSSYKVPPKQCFLNPHFHLGKGVLATEDPVALSFEQIFRGHMAFLRTKKREWVVQPVPFHMKLQQGSNESFKAHLRKENAGKGVWNTHYSNHFYLQLFSPWGSLGLYLLIHDENLGGRETAKYMIQSTSIHNTWALLWKTLLGWTCEGSLESSLWGVPPWISFIPDRLKSGCEKCRGENTHQGTVWLHCFNMLWNC